MDDLLDLDWDRKPPSIGINQSSAPHSSNKNNGSSYNFDALTRSLPQSKPAHAASRNIPTSSSISSKQNINSASAKSSDAFSSLFGFDNGSSSSAPSSSISMAERLKKEKQQQQFGALSSQSSTSSQSTTPTNSTAWDGLDSFLVAPQMKAAPVKVHARPPHLNQVTDDSDLLWGSAPKQSRKMDQESKPQRSGVNSSKRADPFDFSEFEDPGSLQSSALGGVDALQSREKQVAPPRHHSRPADDSEEDDDLLGSLTSAKPIVKSFNTTARAVTPSRQIGAASPPPHIIGQIVEMGFSPAQARQALAATKSGLDVSGALEMLLQEQKDTQPIQGDHDLESDHKLARRMQREEERRRPERFTAARVDRQEEKSKANGIEVPQEWQKQADQIYSQASEIGASMFNKANAFWSTAKAQAQKALDERNFGTESGQSSGRSSPATGSERARSRRWAVPSRDGGNQRKEWEGKPKWMVDAEDADQVETSPEQKKTGTTSSGFKDDEEVRDEISAKSFIDPSIKVQKAEAVDIWDGGGESSKSNKNLKSILTAPTSRRSSPLATGAGSSRQLPIPQKSANIPSTSLEQERKAHRRAIADDASTIQSSLTLKQRGNELFKRGAYIEAEVAYTQALEVLQSNSLRKVALFNNRASARLKNGDARSALSDTKEVLTLIVVTESKKGSPFLLYRPSKEHPLPLPEYADVNLRDGYGKALLRRAQAEEMLEQWETAQSVWSLLERYEKEEGSGKGGITNLRAAQEGGKRCGKMLRGGDIELAPPAQRRVQAAAIQAIAKAERLAKERIRSENAIAAAEEAEKDSLRDIVDSRVSAWKNNKETNVRALLASLHEVVWPGLNWKKVGMHELVMDNQVKRCYMRAIGKLHPDKLTPKTNTIEERMVGGAVFSVLNDAWSAANTS